MNRGRFISRVSQNIGMSTADANELLLMQEWCQQAVDDILVKTHARIEVATITLSVGVYEYRLAQTILAVDDRTIDASTVDIRVASIDEVNDLRRQGTIIGSTYAYVIAIEGDLLEVYPTPTAADVFTIWAVVRPTRMTLDSHDPNNSPYGQLPMLTDVDNAIEEFMLWKAADYDDKVTGITAEKHRAAYESFCKEIRKSVRRQGQRGITPARVGYPSSRPYGRRNDTYPAR